MYTTLGKNDQSERTIEKKKENLSFYGSCLSKGKQMGEASGKVGSFSLPSRFMWAANGMQFPVINFSPGRGESGGDFTNGPTLR